MKRQYNQPEVVKVGTLSKLTKTSKIVGNPPDGLFLRNVGSLANQS